MNYLKTNHLFLVREANSEDAITIAEFQVDMAMESENIVLDLKTVTEGVKAVFDDTAKGKYFVADMEGRVIASTLITYEWSDWRNRTVYWIQSVYVVPEFRKQGVFREIYSAIKDIVEESVEVGGIRLYVDAGNKNAQRVYSRLGMDGSHYHVYEWMK